ncbi:unnamed protein product [Adineta ricciae]|uniref:LITAF domain-containing protein n=1 Tax=Adineta ricciae TaxID=249248 RepID=A0A815C1E8_ADIRI|nr:unnamed protein product [Adineta ricciae]
MNPPAPYNASFNQAEFNKVAPVMNAQSRLSTLSVGDLPVSRTCPQCHRSMATTVEKTNGVTVWSAAGILILLGCVCGCCLIPLCMDDLKDKTHYCPYCNTVVGRKKLFK